MNKNVKGKLEYYAKNTGYYTAKTVNNSVAQWTIAAAATVALPYMGFSNVTYKSDADTQGTEQSETVLNTAYNQQGELLKQIDAYKKLQKRRAAYKDLGADEIALDLVDDMLKIENKINDLSKEFMVATLASGSKEDGIAISEVDFRQIANTILDNGDFALDANIYTAMFDAAKNAEHLDEARATVSIPKNINNTDLIFNNAVNAISKKADDMDDKQASLAFFSLFLGAPFSLFLVANILYLTNKKTKHMQKPKKPDFMKTH